MKGAHLWKRILNEGVIAFPPFGDTEKLQIEIVKATILSVESEAPPTRQIDLRNYKGCAIPFDCLWIEQPFTFLDPATHQKAGLGHIGYLVKSTESINGRGVSYYEISVLPNDPRIVLAGLFDFELSNRGDFVPQSSSVIWPHFMKQFNEDHLNTNRIGSMGQLLDILSILSCKNVSLTPHDNDPKQVRRAIKRHGGTPESYRYHTLVVRPPGAKSDSPGVEIGIMPRHVCRGHFAEYGPEFNKGMLFGKYNGRFFIPPHLKGDKKNGTVEKDYQIPASP